MAKARIKRATVARRTARRRTASRGGRVPLIPQEREVLKEACRRYKHDLPSYLEAARSEFDLIEEIQRTL